MALTANYNYSSVSEAYQTLDLGRIEEMNPVQKLWRSVYVQALRDAMAMQSDAIEWLLFDNVDAPLVASYSDVDLEHYRPAIAEIVYALTVCAARSMYPSKNIRKGSFRWRPLKDKTIMRNGKLTLVKNEIRESAREIMKTPLWDKIRFLAPRLDTEQCKARVMEVYSMVAV